MTKLHLNCSVMTITGITSPAKWKRWQITCTVPFTVSHASASEIRKHHMKHTNSPTKKALLRERKCPVTLDPLTIFSILVVHSKLTWNKNYWKYISVTQEKNHVIISVFRKSCEAPTGASHHRSNVHSLRSCPLLRPLPFGVKPFQTRTVLPVTSHRGREALALP